ncbi:MAG TPA: GntR family transcriptional regulator [Bryobacteraceae bacterium]|nr:GntR family transcriptional regulator [Bryobacteraceae bacterium]
MKRQRDEQTKMRIYAGVLQRILHGDLLPGTRLVETQLAEQYSVSRTVIREVLFMLLRDELVERHHNRGTQVVSFTPDDVEDLYELRKNMELLALRTAIFTMPLEPLAAFEQRLRRLRGRPVKQTADEHAAIDIELHAFVFAHCRNKRLVTYLATISQLLHSLRLLGYEMEDMVRQTGEEHLALVQAFVRRDLATAERLMGEHIDTSKRNALQTMISRRALAMVEEAAS